MTFTDENIETIIAAYKARHGAEIHEEDRPIYAGFLQRQKEAHPEMDITLVAYINDQEERTTNTGRIIHNKPEHPYLEIAVIELYLFDILIGKMPLQTEHSSERTCLKNEDLPMLKVKPA
ncbi:MAG: hypothetical protein ABIH34_01035, partial [Nanoarchaeota archaeon]